MNKFKQLNLEQRYQMEALLKAGNYLEKHQHKGFFSYLIYFSVFLFMASPVFRI